MNIKEELKSIHNVKGESVEKEISIYYKDKELIAARKPNEAFRKYEYINSKLDMLRKLIRNMPFSKGINLVDVELYVFNSNEINALAKREQNGYAIAFSSAIFENIPEDLEYYFLHRDVRKFFYGGKKNVSFHVEKVMNYMLIFLCLHEYYHILNGHCDLSISFGHRIETVASSDEGENQINQILEYDADFCAVRSSVYFLLEKAECREDRIMNGTFLGFSMYYLFLRFEEQGYENLKLCINNLWKSDHPFASIRTVYTLMVITNYYAKHGVCDNELMDVIISITDVCIYFDKIYYDSDTLEKSLIALGYTEEGLKHIEDLDNGWAGVRNSLREYAYIELRETNYLKIRDNAWISKDGQFIKREMNPKLLNYFVRKRKIEGKQ